MRFSRWLFAIAGVYGLVVLAPHYVLENQIGRDYPPAITHPEYFYGFLGVGLAWQIAFLIIAWDPPRFRPLMIPSIIEKISFGAAAIVLYWQQRLPVMMLAAGLVDLTFAILFTVAWWKLRGTHAAGEV